MTSMMSGKSGIGMSFSAMLNLASSIESNNILVTDPASEIPNQRNGHILVIGGNGYGKELVYHALTISKEPTKSTSVRKIRTFYRGGGRR